MSPTCPRRPRRPSRSDELPGRKRNILKLAIATDGPPREFRIFRPGWNKSTKGAALFDAKAAAELMDDYKKRGVDIMIDLEHLSLDEDAKNSREDAQDARGWCKLEMRGGELWAVDVRWTPDGERRLRNKTQRYVSPAFYYDPETKRVTELMNIAICAMPATHEALPLVAASNRAGKPIMALAVEVNKMDLLKELAAKLGLPEDATAEDCMVAIDALLEKVSTASDDGKDDEQKNADDDKGSDEEKLSRMLSKSPKLQARVLAAMSSTSALRKELEQIKQRQRTTEVDALIAANTRKIPKTLEAWARKQTPDVLKEFIANAADVVEEPKTPPKDEPTGGDVKLTDADKEMCKLNNISEEKFLARKKLVHARDKERAAG